jgi:hypothetical protein
MMMYSWLSDPTGERRATMLQRRFEMLIKNKEEIDWNPKMKAPRGDILVRAETYVSDFEFPLKTEVISSNPMDHREGTYLDYGDITVRTLKLPRGVALSMPLDHRTDHHPYVFFTEDIVFPCLQLGGSTWMSLTPAEILSQQSGIRFSRDHVVIGGLGMGWFLHEVQKRSVVKKITVIEKNRELLDWFGNDLCKKYGADVICGDVWEEMEKFPRSCRFALDIWEGFFAAREDWKLESKRRAGWNIWAWGYPRGARR